MTATRDDLTKQRLRALLTERGMSPRAWNVLVRTSRNGARPLADGEREASERLSELGLVTLAHDRARATAKGREFVRTAFDLARSAVPSAREGPTDPAVPSAREGPTDPSVVVGPAMTPAMALGHIWAIAKRNLLRIIRTPQLLVFSSIQPVLFVLLFRYVFGGAIPIPGVRYVDYLMPGIFVQTTLFGGMGTAGGLAEDLKSGVIDRFRSLPMARSAVLAGRTVADLARNLFVAGLMLVVGLLVGFRFHNGFIPGVVAFLLVLVFGYAFSWMFAAVGLAVKDPETAQVAGFLPLFPFVFASSAFVPIETMPGWLQAFAKVQPVSVTVNAVRALTQGGPVATPLVQSLAWTAGLLVVLVPVAVRTYRRS